MTVPGMASLKSWFTGVMCGVLMMGSAWATAVAPTLPIVAATETPAVIEASVPSEASIVTIETPAPVITPKPTPAPTPALEVTLNDEEFNMLCIVAMAEAGNQDEMGIRLVIDTILNRVDSPAFPNDILGVLYQKNQFSCVWDGGIGKCYVREDIAKLVREECTHRTNRDVGFFRTARFGDYGAPMFQHGAHYFNSIHV